MKSIKELLELILKEFIRRKTIDIPYKGLCSVITRLSHTDITINESLLIRRYMRDHRPIKLYYNCYDARTEDIYQFWYKPYETHFRTIWLNKHIKLN